MTHLWDHDHPHFCEHGDFFVAPNQAELVHAEHDSWTDFLGTSWGSHDLDIALLFRWDWDRDDDSGVNMLRLFFYMQSSAHGHSHLVYLEESDEESVREWLSVRAEHLRLLWEPLLARP